MLTIFYDSHCPLCSAEMTHLMQHDNENKIALVDLHDPQLLSQYPQINFDKAMRVLHGEYQGNTLLGLEVTHRAWTLVGKGLWVAPLNWPIIKPVSHLFYLMVAKYRHPISSFLAKVFGLKAKNCDSGACYGKSTDINNRRK